MGRRDKECDIAGEIEILRPRPIQQPPYPSTSQFVQFVCVSRSFVSGRLTWSRFFRPGARENESEAPAPFRHNWSSSPVISETFFFLFFLSKVGASNSWHGHVNHVISSLISPALALIVATSRNNGNLANFQSKEHGGISSALPV